jgi:drug/metabolite transporter (DMT)-like permease
MGSKGDGSLVKKEADARPEGWGGVWAAWKLKSSLPFNLLAFQLFSRRATLPKQLKGALLALASAACISVTFIASKQAMQELSPLAFTPLWFGVASLWGVGFYCFRYGWYVPGGLSNSIRPMIWVGFLNGLANFLFFTSINLGDPTLVAFFSRSETVYTVLLGTWLLGERMRRAEWLGMVIAIVGTGLMTFQASQVVKLMLFLTLVSNFFLALSTLVAKKHIKALSPLILSIVRTLVMSVMLGVVGWAAGEVAWPSQTTWLWIIGGAFFGPFLSYLLFYQSLLYLDLSKGAVIRAMQPLFVAIYGLILFGSVITFPQFIGGVTMIAGVAVMLWKRQ